MNIKTKGLFKVLVIALSMLFAVALAFGISGAWYNTTREAKGTLSMAKGIVIDYSGFNQGADVWEDSASFNLFASQNGMLPGQSVALYNTKIKANASSIDFYARAKLEYKFFTDVEGLTEVTSQIADYSAFINTPTFAQGWVDGRNGDGWFYYATGATFNTIPSADYVDIFAPGQSLTLNIDAPGFNHQGGGYQYSNEILIKRITVTLTLNALQANTAAAEFNGWEIVPQYTDAAGVVYTQNANETWTLTNGTALSGNSSNGTATYSAKMYDSSSYSYTVLSQINNQDVVAIGDNAFLNAIQLTEITIPATVATIGTDAFTGTGLNTVTIEKDDTVVSGIETAGIPTASVLNVPGAVVGDYELTNLSSGGVEIRGIAITLNAVNSDNSSKGEYMAIDNYGNKWYFSICRRPVNEELLNNNWYVSGENVYVSTGADEFIVESYEGAHVKSCDLANKTLQKQIIEIPSYFVNNNFGTLPVIVISGRWAEGEEENVSLFDSYGAKADMLISQVIVPSTVKSIEFYAFHCCICLNSINIPNSVVVLKNNIFANCTNLKSISIPPSSIIKIENSAFSSWNGLNSIIIPNSVTKIDWGAFMGCVNLTTVTIDSSTITALDSSDSCLLDNATTVYVLEGLTVGDYIGNWGHTVTSDKAGYVKYVKNS